MNLAELFLWSRVALSWRYAWLSLLSHRKVGGLHFLRLGRLGFTIYISRQPRPMLEVWS